MRKAWLVRVQDVVESLSAEGDDLTKELLREQLLKLNCYCTGCLEARRSEEKGESDELPF